MIKKNWLDLNPRIKLMVEENEIKEGGHILKDRSRHVTAYLNPKSSVKDTMKFIMELISKTENSFK